MDLRVELLQDSPIVLESGRDLFDRSDSSVRSTLSTPSWLELPSRRHLPPLRFRIMARGRLSIPPASFARQLAIAPNFPPSTRLTRSHGGCPPFGGGSAVGLIAALWTGVLSSLKGVKHGWHSWRWRPPPTNKWSAGMGRHLYRTSVTRAA
jgi:hypothetical protein